MALRKVSLASVAALLRRRPFLAKHDVNPFVTHRTAVLYRLIKERRPRASFRSVTKECAKLRKDKKVMKRVEQRVAQNAKRATTLPAGGNAFALYIRATAKPSKVFSDNRKLFAQAAKSWKAASKATRAKYAALAAKRNKERSRALDKLVAAYAKRKGVEVVSP